MTEDIRNPQSEILQTLSAVAAQMAQVQDEEARLLLIVDAVRALTGATYSSIGFVEGDVIHWRSAAGKPIEEIRGYRQSVSDGLCGWVVRHGRARRSGDVLREPDLLRQYAEMRSELDVPILVGDEVIGVLSAESPAVNAFTAGHETTLAILAGYVALTR